jgi:hypothetical protein
VSTVNREAAGTQQDLAKARDAAAPDRRLAHPIQAGRDDVHDPSTEFLVFEDVAAPEYDELRSDPRVPKSAT